MKEANIAAENFEKWNNALLSKDPAKVAELYSLDATFLPTLSPEFKKGREEAKEYFIHFLQKNPSGQIIEQEVQEIGDNAYLHSGMYNFTVGPENERQTVEARFTFVWHKKDAKNWEIIHHHSSLKPKG